MSKYIAVDDLKMCVDILADKMIDSGAKAIKQVVNIADSLSTIELVRCKDCKHWLNDHICTQWSGYYGTIETLADDFCSYRKRFNDIYMEDK